MSSTTLPPVNYDGPALLEVEIDGTEYRLDAGKHGTALCISSRPAGSWSWQFGGEARWDAHTLRCKAFDRHLLDRIAPLFMEAITNMD